MAKKTITKDQLLQKIWKAAVKDIQQLLDYGHGPEDFADGDNSFCWDEVTTVLNTNCASLLALSELKILKNSKYRGEVALSGLDRKKILIDLESSCLSKSAVASIKALLSDRKKQK